MKNWKLPKPEDFTEIDGYSFKLAAAYSKMSVELFTLLVYMDGLHDLVDILDKDEIKKRIEKLLKPFDDENN